MKHIYIYIDRKMDTRKYFGYLITYKHDVSNKHVHTWFNREELIVMSSN